ncbi:Uncharacterized protein conserved in bacteria [Clostridium putrefaciens]|uniref:Uncharacterized protein conserved in bacteria n=1 Tax=Clostridium putrefaciens TaxID=99675 RepID=A0A381JCA1_9CLOT|nr:DUF1653 domain-containing protein [Clostridium putrefaciens]SUY48012.1 Uncharacterized protein conserved in bacteria [Clostridium putrefaciens]
MVSKREIKNETFYKHFKGNYYKVIYIAKHSETLEDMVVYQPQYGDMSIWVRPLSMFLEQVEFNGKVVNRFEECGYKDLNTDK